MIRAERLPHMMKTKLRAAMKMQAALTLAMTKKMVTMMMRRKGQKEEARMGRNMLQQTKVGSHSSTAC